MPTAIITFDDVVASQLTNAVPVLRQHQFQATFFVCDWFSDSSVNPLQQGMKTTDLIAINRLGYEIGNHSKTHSSPGRLSVEENLAEMEAIETLCSSFNLPAPRVYAYPGGPYAQTASDAAQRKGYLAARTTGNQPLDLAHLNRFDMHSYAICDDQPEVFEQAFTALQNGLPVILTYHGTPDIQHPWVNVAPEHFAAQMQRLADLNCHCPTFTQFLRSLEH